MTRRWIITVTSEDGTESAWGPWADGVIADDLARKLRDGVGDETGSLRIRVMRVDRWPGLRAAVEELR
jgi:hypothetical protein